MRRIVITVFIIVINMILQATVFEYIAIMGIKPQTGLAIIVCLSFMRGDVEGMFLGVFSGLLQDLLFAPFIGVHTCLCAIVGYLCGKFFAGFYNESVVIPGLLTVAAVFIYEFMYYIIMVLTAGYIDVLHFLGTIILPEVVYTGIISVFLYKILYNINEKIIYSEQFNRKLF